MEQMLPTVTWGKEFLLAPYGGRNVGQYYKVLTSQNSTSFIRRCGSSTTTTILPSLGSSSNFSTASNEYCSVVSNNPIAIYQLSPGYSLDSLGDPAIATIPAIHQYQNTAHFTTFNSSDFSVNYISITLTASQFNSSSILLNDQPVDCDWQSIYNTSGSVVGYGCTTNVSAGSMHTVHHTGQEAGLAVLVYGFDYHQAYGYIAGLTHPVVTPGLCLQNVGSL